MGNNKRKREEAERFNRWREQESIDKENRIKARVEYEASPEGKEAMKVSSKKFSTFLMMASVLATMDNTGRKP